MSPPENNVPPAARVQAILRAVARLAAHPRPESLSDGLSAGMARHCLTMATDLIHEAGLKEACRVPGIPPRSSIIVAARGVFTAPLEWIVMLTGIGSDVHLKAPATAPRFCEAASLAFQAEGLPVSSSTARTLPLADCLVAMGRDSTMDQLRVSTPDTRLSLHGHRFSLAVVRGDDPSSAEALVEDVVLYDGRGCFTPTAILLLGDAAAASRLGAHMAVAMREACIRWPPGEIHPLHGPERRRREALARVLGEIWSGPGWSVAVLPPRHLPVSAVPRCISIHPIATLADVARLLAPHRPHLAACATDLKDVHALVDIQFERICRPGHLQRPLLGRPHGGREPLRPLMRHVSLEL